MLSRRMAANILGQTLPMLHACGKAQPCCKCAGLRCVHFSWYMWYFWANRGQGVPFLHPLPVSFNATTKKGLITCRGAPFETDNMGRLLGGNGHAFTREGAKLADAMRPRTL